MRTAHILTRRSAPEFGEVSVILRMGLSDEDAGGSERLQRGEGSVGRRLLVGRGGSRSGLSESRSHPSQPRPRRRPLHRGGWTRAYPGDRLLRRKPDSGPERDRLAGHRLAGTSRSRAGRESRRPDCRGRRRIHPGHGGPHPRRKCPPGHLGSVRDRGPPSHRRNGPGLSRHGGTPDPGTWFSSVKVAGGGVEAHPDRGLGPILGAQYTLSRGVLTLTAQLLPISPLNPGPGTPGEDTGSHGASGRERPLGSNGISPGCGPGIHGHLQGRGLDRPSGAGSGSEPVSFRLTLQGEGRAGRQKPLFRNRSGRSRGRGRVRGRSVHRKPQCGEPRSGPGQFRLGKKSLVPPRRHCEPRPGHTPRISSSSAGTRSTKVQARPGPTTRTPTATISTSGTSGSGPFGS